ncbi:MAG: alkaline phosphatase family protein [Clostridia bacterium]|nr:alkaline phosphatase family protein [Clostridia bacterium]
MMSNSFGAYRHVCIIGCDGMGTFNRNACTPNIDALFKNGATNFTTLAAKPSVSAQSWTSLLTGAIPEVHKLTNYDMHPIPELPTVFKMVEDAFPSSERAVFSAWPPIPLKIISENGGMTSYAVGPTAAPEDRKGDIDFWIEVDEDICNKTLDYLNSHEPKLLFVQFNSTDTFGHLRGYGSVEQLKAIESLDVLIGKIADKYKEKGIFDDTLIIVTADHGGTNYSKSLGTHGGWTDEEKYVFLGVAGKNVMNGTIGRSCVRDIPAIVLHALGIKAPDFDKGGYAAQLPVGIFEDAGVTCRIELYPKEQVFDRKNYIQPKKDSSEYIGNFIDESRIRFWQTFENGVEDVTGNCRVTTKNGFVKIYNGGLLGNYGELGNGALKIEGVKVSDIFTFSFWFKTSSNSLWLDMFSNKNGKDDGFSIALTSDFVCLWLKDPDGIPLKIGSNYVADSDGTLRINPHKADIKFNDMSEAAKKDSWTHFMLTVDTKKNSVNTYVNFKPVHVYVCDALVYDRYGFDFLYKLSDFFNLDTLYMGLEQDPTPGLYKLIDDVMILDGEADPEKLEKYYRNILTKE